MPEITLQAIAKTVETVLKDELDPIKTTLAAHTELLNQHTTQLDAIAKDVKTLLDDKAITTARIERVEHAVKLLAGKAGLKLDW